MVSPVITRARRGSGSARERSPGVWEIRVVVGFDPVLARSVQRSFTMHGDAHQARRRQAELVEGLGVSRVLFTTEAARMSVAELLGRWAQAAHRWKPATVVSHTSVARALSADGVGRRRLALLTPGDVVAATLRWQVSGVPAPTVCGRWLVLRSALSWAVGEGILRSNPLAGQRGPPRPTPRRHHSVAEVRQLLSFAEARAAQATAELLADPSSPRGRRQAFAAEQDLLLVRLAADSGARRGELAVLRFADLDGRVLNLERSLSHGVLGSTKSGRSRRITLGATTVALVQSHLRTWQRLAQPAPRPECTTGSSRRGRSGAHI
jgi:hypothetical protein